MAWVLDLDGVVWLADDAIPGSAAAVHTLRARGKQVVFLTNNSAGTLDEYVAKLNRVGISAKPADVVTSAQAAARLVEPGERVLVCAGPGVTEAVTERGAEAVLVGAADAVVVGWHRDFDYERLTAACRAVFGGARLIGTNDDPTYPTNAGPLPGGGALLAAVAYATGVSATVAGKPHDAILDVLRDVADPIEVVVGDRPSTDGLLARRLGATFALVLSGVTLSESSAVDPKPDVVAADLRALVAALSEESERGQIP